jgi:hypothetical protein
MKSYFYQPKEIYSMNSGDMPLMLLGLVLWVFRWGYEELIAIARFCLEPPFLLFMTINLAIMHLRAIGVLEKRLNWLEHRLSKLEDGK